MAIKPSNVSYNKDGLIVAGEKLPCKRPRLEFARKLQLWFGGKEPHTDGNIGASGFGFERDENGVPVRIPHFGSVRLGKDVQIGVNTVICRGTISDTVIGDHVKLDANVFIAHNVEIGCCTLVVAGAVICGSAKIGERCWIGANATIKEHVSVGNDAIVGMGAVVLRDVPPNTVVVGNPARFLRERK
jgi:UDP-3-O-[3-hydroxymyristoyl] glucosamine N-acyltransferase